MHHPRDLVKLTGTITNYTRTRTEASFVFTDNDRTALGVIAIAAGMAGMSGQAISTAVSATATEDADYVEFDMNGEVIKGWVWRSPFRNGDEIEIAAVWRNEGHYELACIARPSDHVIALYPHCSRGKRRHVTNAIKWLLVGVGWWLAFLAGLTLLTTGWSSFVPVMTEGFAYVALGSFAFFGLMTFSLAGKWMPFVRLAEKVFTTLGFPDPSNVDLVKSSKAQRRLDDPGEYGTFYFRY